MTFKKIFLLVASAMFFCSNVNAQTDFFWSLQDLNSGAVNADLVTEFAPGESGTMYLYYTTNGPADSDVSVGAYVDIEAIQTGLIQFDAAETFDFDILLFGNVAGVRWGDIVGATAAVESDFIDELGAFSIFSGNGMLEDHNGSGFLVDTGYDAGADAFLFAKVDFTVAADAAGGSLVDIVTTAGFNGIVNAGVAVPATFGGASIMVAEAVILGDFNGDEDVTMCDVNPFVQAILSGEFNEVADINLDQKVDLLDIRPFVQLLTN